MDKKNKRNQRNKMTARRHFNPNTPRMLIEQAFSRFTNVATTNAKVELDWDALDRMNDIYADMIENWSYTQHMNREALERVKLDARLAMLMTLIRELALATPDGEMHKIAMFHNLCRSEFVAFPSSLASAIDNNGECEFDEYIVRIKDKVYNIHKFSFYLARVWMDHPSFRGLYDLDFRHAVTERYLIQKANTDDAIEAGQIVQTVKLHDQPYEPFFGDEASIKAIKGKVETILQSKYEQGYVEQVVKYAPRQIPAWQGGTATEVDLITVYDPLTAVEVRRFYPVLRISEHRSEQMNPLRIWIGLMNLEMPDHQQMVCAALMLVANRSWFSIRNYNNKLHRLVPEVPAAWNITPATLLDTLNLRLFRMIGEESGRDTIPVVVDDVFDYLDNGACSMLERIFQTIVM
ncbi:hypothetical protein BDB00DRAFT_891946 [Zychaea mexicana]|uniref:uncharacterized protein n=1 Tax=Zychaea mexicana TaxID=64656 RepID=UPI0022FE102D|nr:uncharacterized protein BDB00DRAFT_891946 [Zychaea mexicana]KAI9484755.1 hypothetical protein BDB00DRAFT_891946 [Zychaea mexicana]